MQTVGYYCDECRRKYVRHVCRDGLPCGHDKDAAIFVYAKHYAKSGERVAMEWKGSKIDVWISQKPRDRNVSYGSSLARQLWEQEVVSETGVTNSEYEAVTLGAWLKKQPEILIRAFLARWESCKEPPDWWLISHAHCDYTEGDDPIYQALGQSPAS